MELDIIKAIGWTTAGIFLMLERFSVLDLRIDGIHWCFMLLNVSPENDDFL